MRAIRNGTKHTHKKKKKKTLQCIEWLLVRISTWLVPVSGQQFKQIKCRDLLVALRLTTVGFTVGAICVWCVWEWYRARGSLALMPVAGRRWPHSFLVAIGDVKAVALGHTVGGLVKGG